jgi:hypothetical protein
MARLEWMCNLPDFMGIPPPASRTRDNGKVTRHTHAVHENISKIAIGPIKAVLCRILTQWHASIHAPFAYQLQIGRMIVREGP